MWSTNLDFTDKVYGPTEALRVTAKFMTGLAFENKKTEEEESFG